MENVAESLEHIKTIKDEYEQLRAFKRLERRVSYEKITDIFKTFKMNVNEIDKISKEVIGYMVKSNNYKDAFTKMSMMGNIVYPEDLLDRYVSYKIQQSFENALYFNKIFKDLNNATYKEIYKDIQSYIEKQIMSNTEQLGKYYMDKKYFSCLDSRYKKNSYMNGCIERLYLFCYEDDLNLRVSKFLEKFIFQDEDFKKNYNCKFSFSSRLLNICKFDFELFNSITKKYEDKLDLVNDKEKENVLIFDLIKILKEGKYKFKEINENLILQYFSMESLFKDEKSIIKAVYDVDFETGIKIDENILLFLEKVTKQAIDKNLISEEIKNVMTTFLITSRMVSNKLLEKELTDNIPFLDCIHEIDFVDHFPNYTTKTIISADELKRIFTEYFARYSNNVLNEIMDNKSLSKNKNRL
ncbi:TPA: hypothetical protein NV714_003692 [Escherichia coli]|nr:hypothetical protein [Escherichia coli]